jgi:hypothetical protein
MRKDHINAANLSFATIAAGFAFFTADFTPAAWLCHSLRLLSLIRKKTRKLDYRRDGKSLAA